MKTNVSMYDFCKVTADMLFLYPVQTYEDYLKVEVRKPISRTVFDLFVEDTYLLGSSLLNVWILDYCQKHNFDIDTEHISNIAGKAITLSYVKHISDSTLHQIDIESKAQRFTTDLDDILKDFYNSDFIKLNISLYDRFEQFYCARIFKKYNVDFMNISTQSDLVNLVEIQSNLLLIIVKEQLKHFRISKGNDTSAHLSKPIEHDNELKFVRKKTERFSKFKTWVDESFVNKTIFLISSLFLVALLFIFIPKGIQLVNKIHKINTEVVYILSGHSIYHLYKDCSNMSNPQTIDEREAVLKIGAKRCEKCYAGVKDYHRKHSKAEITSDIKQDYADSFAVINFDRSQNRLEISYYLNKSKNQLLQDTDLGMFSSLQNHYYFLLYECATASGSAKREYDMNKHFDVDVYAYMIDPSGEIIGEVVNGKCPILTEILNQVND